MNAKSPRFYSAIATAFLLAYAAGCGPPQASESTDSKGTKVTTGSSLDPAYGADSGRRADSAVTDASEIDAQAVTTPIVLSSSPALGAVEVSANETIRATFSEPMDSATINTQTFRLTSASAMPVPGSVAYANAQAAFTPDAPLPDDSLFTGTILREARSAAGIRLEAAYVWTFATGSSTPPRAVVALLSAANYVMLAKSAISTVPTSKITGDVAVSPAASTYITGFGLVADASGVFANSDQIMGKVFGANNTLPTPATLTVAVGDMERAYADAEARAAEVSELGRGQIGGMTLSPAIYRWSTGLSMNADVTLRGSASDVWVLQVAGGLTMGSSTRVLLAGGALPSHVFWQIAGAVEIGANAHCAGVLLAKTSVALQTGASITGRILAQTAITLDASTITAAGG